MPKASRKMPSRRIGEVPANATRSAVKAAFDAHPHLLRHNAERKDCLYISGFQTSNGVPVALDKMSASKQPIWVRLADFPVHALPRIDRKFYSPEDGRNSNLHKFGSDFKSGHLVRLYPKTCGEALEIVELLLRVGGAG